jgi:hypothetical protein
MRVKRRLFTLRILQRSLRKNGQRMQSNNNKAPAKTNLRS